MTTTTSSGRAKLRGEMPSLSLVLYPSHLTLSLLFALVDTSCPPSLVVCCYFVVRTTMSPPVAKTMTTTTMTLMIKTLARTKRRVRTLPPRHPAAARHSTSSMAWTSLRDRNPQPMPTQMARPAPAVTATAGPGWTSSEDCSVTTRHQLRPHVRPRWCRYPFVGK